MIRNEDSINCFRESNTNWKWVMDNKDILQEFLSEFVIKEEEVNEIDSK